MTLQDILFIAGQSGLFKFVSQGHNTIIVENLSDHKRTSVLISSKLIKLKDITIFTEDENVPLCNVFKAIRAKENGGLAISPKSSDAELKNYFAEVLPEYDRNRVYMSDIRKVVMWYNYLHELGITDFESSESHPKTEKNQENEISVENK